MLQKKVMNRFLITLVLGLSLVLGSSLTAFGASTDCTVNAGATLSNISLSNQASCSNLIKNSPQLQNLNCLQVGQVTQKPTYNPTAAANCTSANQSICQPTSTSANKGTCQPTCTSANKGTCPTNSCQPAKAAPVTPVTSQPAPTKQTSAPVAAPAKDQSTTSISAFEQQVLDLTNAERTKAGLSPLKLNTELSNVARVKSQDMRDNKYFDHNSPTYGSPFDMMQKFGIKFTAAGENIAAGQTTPQAVVTGWMNSPGHRQNILNANYTEIGVGYAAGGSYGHYWTQEFIRS